MFDYVEEIECTCGGLVGELFGIDYDADDDDIIRTVQGVCTRCGKKYIYNERYKLLGCYNVREN